MKINIKKKQIISIKLRIFLLLLCTYKSIPQFQFTYTTEFSFGYLLENCVVQIFNIKFDIYYFKVPLGRSETHISILLDNICEKLSDYVRATRKSDNQLMIFNLMSPSGGMNPIMSEVDIIQDGDLNKSLEHYVSAIYYVLYLLKVLCH